MDTNFAADPAVVAIAENLRELTARTANLEIINSEAFTEAADWLKSIKTSLREIEDARVRITRPMNEALREINAQARASAEPFLETEGRIKRAILAYTQKQERIRLEEQRKRDLEAKQERERLQKIADEARLKAEREARERREAAEKAAAEGRAEEARKLQAAAARIEDRAQAKAETFENRAAATVATVVQAETPKVSGLSVRDNWVFEIVDESKVLIKTPDLVKIGKLVKSLKADAQSLVGAGVRIWNEKIAASGRA
jgi:hypothetical protein